MKICGFTYLHPFPVEILKSSIYSSVQYFLLGLPIIRTVEKGEGRGGKRSRARAPRGPVNILCHTILSLLYTPAMHFYGN